METDTKRATLSAVLFADLHQYSRLVAANELDTVEFVTRCFQLFRDHCNAFGAEFIKTTGDGVLIAFDSASVAIEYAMTIQERIRAIGEGSAPVSQFRIGLHMGEVQRRGGDIFGHAVNLAARIEALAEPGGVCVSQDVYHAVHSNPRYGFRFGGRAALKNIPEPVPIYHVYALDVAAVGRGAERLVVSVIDGLALSTEQGESLPVRSPTARAVLGYLALSNRPQDTQDRIAALIWPDRTLPEARRALAACVKGVERIIAPNLHDGLLRRGDMIGLSPSRTEVDLPRVLEDLHRGTVDDLLLERADWPDAILRGLEDVSPLFNAWLSVTRHNWRARVSEALEASLERFRSTEPALRRAAEALLLLEPSHERAARHLIRHYAELGNVSAAVRVYERLRTILREQFSLAPSTDTEQLMKTLSAPRAAGPAVPRHSRRARPPSVAVGVFYAHSELLTPAVVGFRADLIANLSKFRELTVVETQDNHDPPGPSYVLTAECVDIRHNIRLFVKLLQPGSQRIVWSESFQLTFDNWFEIQKRLVCQISSSLEIYLSQDRISRNLLASLNDLDVYDAWLRGEHLLTRWSPSGDDEAAELFKHVIGEDPEYAPAHASLASVLNSMHLVRPGCRPDGDRSRRALELAQRAVEIDPLDARSHLVVAWTTALLHRFEQSEVHYELAAELNPNSPKTLVSAALGLAFMGRQDAAARLLDRAMALTSLFLDYQWSHIAAIRYLTGDLEGAVRAAERSKNCIIDTPGWKAAALHRLGRVEEARAALAQLFEVVSRAWQGAGPATPSAILDWFMAAFPIKQEQDRLGFAVLNDLAASLP